MICLVGLGGFSTYVLLSPAHSLALILDIIDLPYSFKLQLLLIAVVNIFACFGFERFAERPIAKAISMTRRFIRAKRGKKRHDREHQYKAIESSMR